MPTSKRTWQKPEALKGRPSQGSPAQIETCHAAMDPHPCDPTPRAR